MSTEERDRSGSAAGWQNLRAAAVRPVRRVVLAASRHQFADADERIGILADHIDRLEADLQSMSGNVRALADRVRDQESRWDNAARQLSGTEQRLRLLSARSAAESAPTSQLGPGDANPGQQSELFDYVGFEREFRGTPDEIRATLVERYAEVLSDVSGPIIDIGCGRGEFLAAMAERGLDVVGVEPDPDMAHEARGRGLTVHQATASEYLHRLPDASLGAVVSFQVAEHLVLNDLLEFVSLSAQKLQTGGVFLAETPNPSSWIVMHTSFIYDPTHTWPLAPPLLAFLCRSVGLRDIDVRYFAPAEGFQLPIAYDDGAPELSAAVATAFEQLNHHLYGPQDYALLARR